MMPQLVMLKIGNYQNLMTGVTTSSRIFVQEKFLVTETKIETMFSEIIQHINITIYLLHKQRTL